MKYLFLLLVSILAASPALATNTSYFKEFFYEKRTETPIDPNDPVRTYYHRVVEHREDWIIAPATATTLRRIGTVELYLLETMDFRVLLTEFDERGSGPVTSLKPVSCAEFTGTMKFNGNTLELWTGGALFGVLTQDQLDFTVPVPYTVQALRLDLVSPSLPQPWLNRSGRLFGLGDSREMQNVTCPMIFPATPIQGPTRTRLNTPSTAPGIHSNADDLAYFNQFLYLEENTSGDPDFPTYQYRWLVAEIFSDWKIPVTTMPGVDSVEFSQDIALYPDSTFALVYKELHWMGSGFFSRNCQIIEGTWKVSNGEMQMYDQTARLMYIGRRGLNKHGQQIVQLEPQLDLATPGYKGIRGVENYTFANFEFKKSCFPF